jgi:hypothetical protein
MEIENKQAFAFFKMRKMFKIQVSGEEMEKPLSNRFSTWKSGKASIANKYTP